MYGYENMNARLTWNGGQQQQNRMIKDKLRSLKAAIGRSYQTATIFLQKNIEAEFDRGFKCLINPDKLKNDYDQKYLSIPYEDIQINKPKVGKTSEGQVETLIKTGDVFYWKETDSYWIIYLQFKEEYAYFRADIRQCKQTLDINGHKYWIYFKGSDETTIPWNQKGGVEWNDMNYSAMFYITKNEETEAYLHRFTKLKINNKSYQVAAVDWNGGDGILEVCLEEAFNNSMEEAQQEQKKQEEQEREEEKQEKMDTQSAYIEGPQVVYPYDIVKYEIKNCYDGRWIAPLGITKLRTQTPFAAEIEIITGKSGQFVLSYCNKDNEIMAQLPITIESI